ncbi:DASS family sodium-coupled anion symporter [Ammoniphilus sp. CFH 90114]|uniref:SLC13 family permease n=1 Tax=Ammoniphilus sp. CFH 90114 TaxID=2493665 RepID=UPI00100FD2C4|nr:DASS family sodium-coupled anion symporter [Ammoniphilus sp. CFH 90114]RXT07216.1 SLC13/DASS family transporter [Ammoniphilus sp. CFH 90114]
MREASRYVFFLLSLIVGYFVYIISDTLTEPMRVTLAIFVIAVILWVTEWIPLFLTSLLVLFLEAILLTDERLLGGNSLTLFFEPFFSPIITLFLGGFALSHAIHKYEIDRMLAYWILKRSKGIPDRMVTFFLLSSAAMSMWISNTATTLLLMILVLPILKPYGGNPFSKSILLAITVGSTVGGMATPIGTPPNAIAMYTFMKQGVTQVSFSLWFLLAIPLCLLVLFVARMGLEVFYPTNDMTPISLPKQKPKPKGRVSAVITSIFLLTVGLWLMTPIQQIPDGVVALVPFILLYLTKILEPQDLKHMGWDTLLLVGGGMSLGVAIKESGLAKYILEQLLLMEISPSALVLSLVILSLVVSTFISNTVATSLIIPLAISFDTNLIVTVTMIVLSSSLALALPISSPSNAIIFSSGYVRSWDMIKIGGLVSIFGFLILYLMARFYWPLVIAIT